MINVDITPILEQFAKDSQSVTKEVITPLLPSDAGDSDGWVTLILGCLVIAAVGFGVYAVTCEDGKTAKMRYNSRGAVISKKEPMGHKIEDDHVNS